MTKLMKLLTNMSEKSVLSQRKGREGSHQPTLSKRRPFRRKSTVLSTLSNEQPFIASPRSDSQLLGPVEIADLLSQLADYTVERAAYALAKPALIQEHPGKFVVFVGEDMIGPFDSFPGAVRAARQKYGRVPIYTKELLADDAVR